jgi:hypothetical protein
MANEDAALPSTHWLVPELDLQTQLRQELDRRTAAKLSRDELSVLVDKLIVDWYHRSALLDNLLGRIRSMEVEMALLMAKPSPAAPTEEHYEWAADLLRDLGR